jgi:hypothetical protein
MEKESKFPIVSVTDFDAQAFTRERTLEADRRLLLERVCKLSVLRSKSSGSDCTDGSGDGRLVSVLRDNESHSLVLDGLVRPALIGHRALGLDPGGTAQARSTLEDGVQYHV